MLSVKKEIRLTRQHRDRIKALSSNGLLYRYLYANRTHKSINSFMNTWIEFVEQMSIAEPEEFKNALLIFPPLEKSYYRCLPGTMARLVEAIGYLKKTSSREGMLVSLFETRADSLRQGNLDQMYAGNQVHAFPYAMWALGLSRTTVSNKMDPYYSAPTADFNAQIIFSSFQRLNAKLAEVQLEEYKECKTCFNAMMDLVDTSDHYHFKDPERAPKAILNLTEEHRELWETLELGDLNSYIRLDTESYMPVGLVPEIMQALKKTIQALKPEYIKSDSVKHLNELTDFKQALNIAECLSSESWVEKEQAIYALWLLGDRLSNNNPNLFLHILSYVGKLHPSYQVRGNSLTIEEDAFSYVQDQLEAIKASARFERSHLVDKIGRIENRLAYYLGNSASVRAHYPNVLKTIKGDKRIDLLTVLQNHDAMSLT